MGGVLMKKRFLMACWLAFLVAFGAQQPAPLAAMPAEDVAAKNVIAGNAVFEGWYADPVKITTEGVSKQVIK